MFLQGMLAAFLLTSLLAAAEPSTTDIFSVRSFRNPTTKAKIPVTAQLFGDEELKILTQAVVGAKNDQCAIPLVERKAGKTGDPMATPIGPNRVDSASLVPAPMPACKGWNK